MLTATAHNQDDGASRTPAPRHRKILHVDMDAFYASVEQRDNPELRGKPLAVGYGQARGVVAAASYEARKFGVYSAMPSVTAKRKCPELIFVPPRFDVYRAVSREIRAIFAEYTPIIEPLSLDEAYLDVTENIPGIPTATQIAQEIRAKIRERVHLTASAGISYNKFLAKLASDHNKPDGWFVITPAMGAAFVEALPVKKFHGIGPATASKMNALGIKTGLDLRAQTLPFLRQHFGKAGMFYYWISRGVDERPVCPDRERKSIGAENTFLNDIEVIEEARNALQPIIEKVWRYCENSDTHGRTVTLKVKYADFQTVTRSHTGASYFEDFGLFSQVSNTLLEQLFPVQKGIRLLGITLSSLRRAQMCGDDQLPLELGLPPDRIPRPPHDRSRAGGRNHDEA